MTRVKKISRDLVADLQERRLWPVALALLVALVAVPTVLSKPVEEHPAPADSQGASAVPAKGSGSILTETQPVVSLSQAPPRGFRRAVRRLPRKDPFVQQAKPKPSKTSEEGGPSSEGAAAGGGGDATADAGTITAPPGSSDGGLTDTPPQSDVVLFEYQAAVSFGEVGDTKNSTLSRLDTLPSETDPVVVFMGVLTDGETAVFLVSDEAVARGDGECNPDPTNCKFVYMKKGDVELIDVPGTDGDSTVTTYELRLRSIDVKKLKSGDSSSGAGAKGSRARGSRASSSKSRKAAQVRREKRLFGVFDLIGF
jgi:hypothetical protein